MAHSVLTARHGLAQFAHERPRPVRRQRCTHDNALLGRRVLDVFKARPENQTHEVLAALNMAALCKEGRNGFRLSHACRPALSHSRPLVAGGEPRIVTGARSGVHCGGVHGLGQSFPGHYDLGRNDQFLSSLHFLHGHEGKPPVSSAHLLDAAQRRYEHIVHAEKVQKLPASAHPDLLRAPRGCVPFVDTLEGRASHVRDRYTGQASDGYAFVNHSTNMAGERA